VLPGAAQACIQAAFASAHTARVPLTLLRLDNPALPSLYTHCLTLIRPDQHIAWGGLAWPAHEAFDVFAMATGQAGLPRSNLTSTTETVHESSY
jgi:hypothetical protein